MPVRVYEVTVESELADLFEAYLPFVTGFISLVEVEA